MGGRRWERRAAGRGRRGYAALALLTIAVGLASRAVRPWLPAAAGDVLGDALWAAMMFWWVGVGRPRASTRARAAAALATAALVEAAQLYRVPWLDAVRRTTLGHLVLGSAFDWRDLGAYALGVAAAAALDHELWRRPARLVPND